MDMLKLQKGKAVFFHHIDDLMQKSCNSSVNALELHLFCII